MTVDPSAVGVKAATQEFKYDWKTVVLYALGIGATRDELDFLYEGRGPRVFPTFGVVPAYPVVADLLARCGGDLALMVHGSQSIRLHRPIPAAGTLHTEGEIVGVYDLKKLAQVSFLTRSSVAGELCFETEWSILFREGGGFGGRPPPKPPVGKIPSGLVPLFTSEARSTPEQALLYRLSGDLNPLHADPDFAARVGFADGPILHGLCTFGFLGRAVVHGACGSDPGRLVELGAQFRRPVWPGDTIRTSGYDLGDGMIGLQAFAADRPDPVLTSCWAKLRPVEKQD